MEARSDIHTYMHICIYARAFSLIYTHTHLNIPYTNFYVYTGNSKAPSHVARSRSGSASSRASSDDGGGLAYRLWKKKTGWGSEIGGCVWGGGGAHPLHHDIKSRALYKSGWSQHGTHCNTLQRTSTQRVQMWEKLCVLSHGIWKWTWGMHATCELGCTGAFQNISLFWENERQEEYRALFRIPTVNPQSKRKRWREIKKNSSVPKDFLKIAHWNLLCLNDRFLSKNRIEESSDLFCIKRLEISDCNFNFEEPPFLTPKDKRIEKVLQNKRWEFWRLGRGNEVRHRLPSLN